ncbi:uncharacterized protein [Anoplolepis gracilipes]|uniref:uncharacterized protein n=1 Tax=Anoplolepis gracilipes TaxID=354296 RepID=UPI003BA303CC
MHEEVHMLIVKKKRRFCIPKNLNIDYAWHIIARVIAQEIGAPDYIRIPYCFDTNAYKIGNIFVPIGTQVTCFRAIPILKVLGPISNFALKTETNLKWLSKEFHSMRTSGDKASFRINVGSGKKHINFTGRNYYFLSTTHDMLPVGNITINRAAHEDLATVKWFGLITNVVVTKIFELRIIKDIRERTLYIGDNEHTILFKYEICEIDENGTVIKSEMKKIRCKWLPIGDKESDNLPLSEIRSTINKTR